MATAKESPSSTRSQADCLSRVPYRVFTDPEVYSMERQRVFAGPVWNYVALSAEVSEPGHYRRSYVGDVPVVVIRADDGTVRVLVNRCAHRGALVVREQSGSTRRLHCLYHDWTYDLSGNLRAVPFRRGVGGAGGGYGPDFDTAEHGMTPLRVEERNGLVFATMSASTPPLEDYLGAVAPFLWRVFDGRPIEVIGSLRQRIGANWKLYAENTKDAYHGGLLHPFHTTFGTYRSTMRGEVIEEASGAGVIVAYRGDPDETSKEMRAVAEEGLSAHKSGYELNAPDLVEIDWEYGDRISTLIITLFPSLVVHQIGNTLATRHTVPRGPGAFDLWWTFFGYRGEPAALRQRRLIQANLVGPSGYISLEDAEALEAVQQAVASAAQGECSLIEMGGCHAVLGAAVPDLVNENAIRGMWGTWRQMMGAEVVGD